MNSFVNHYQTIRETPTLKKLGHHFKTLRAELGIEGRKLDPSLLNPRGKFDLSLNLFVDGLKKLISSPSFAPNLESSSRDLLQIEIENAGKASNPLSKLTQASEVWKKVSGLEISPDTTLVVLPHGTRNRNFLSRRNEKRNTHPIGD